jgi:hypothetical protein
MLADPEARRAVITELALRLGDRLGRTGVMKCMYLLQTLAGLKLGYQFRLYTYGPYDGQVLDDLSVAEALGAVRSKAFEWQGGTGYVITAGPSAQVALNRARRYLDSADQAIDWVVDKFGSRAATELELATTIIFVDQASHRSDEKISTSELVRRVHDIKPHHILDKVEGVIAELNRDGFLKSLRHPERGASRGRAQLGLRSQS